MMTRLLLQWVLFLVIVALSGLLSSQHENCLTFAMKEPRRAGRFPATNLFAFISSKEVDVSAGHGQLISHRQIKADLPDGGKEGAEIYFNHEHRLPISFQSSMVILQNTREKENSGSAAKNSLLRRLLEEPESSSVGQENSESGDSQKNNGEITQDKMKVERINEEGKESDHHVESKADKVEDSKVEGGSPENFSVQTDNIQGSAAEKEQTQKQEQKSGESKDESKGLEEIREDPRKSEEEHIENSNPQKDGEVDQKLDGNSGEAFEEENKTRILEDKINSGDQNVEDIKKDDTNDLTRVSESKDWQDQGQKQDDLKGHELKAEEKVHEAEYQKHDALELKGLQNETDRQEPSMDRHSDGEHNKLEKKIEDAKVDEETKESETTSELKHDMNKADDNKQDTEQKKDLGAGSIEEKVEEKKDDVKLQEYPKEAEATIEHKDEVNKVEDNRQVEGEQKIQKETKEPEATSQHEVDKNKAEDNKEYAVQQQENPAVSTEGNTESKEVQEKEDIQVNLKPVEDKAEVRTEWKEDASETSKQEEKHESPSEPDSNQVTEENENHSNPENLVEDKKESENEVKVEENPETDSDKKQPDSGEVRVDEQPSEEEIPNENPVNLETNEQKSSDEDLKPDDSDKVHGSEEDQSQTVANQETGTSWSTELQNAGDDYHDIVRELSDLPSKFHETAGHVAQQLLPEFEKVSNKSKDYFLLANQQITLRFLPLLGEQYAPQVASLICYGLLLLPLALVIFLVDRVRSIFSLQRVILSANIYLATYFASLVLAFFIIGTEPILFVVQNAPSNFALLQLLQGGGYLVYLILHATNVVSTCTYGAVLEKVSALVHWLLATLVGLHYYVTVFHRAMAQRVPETSWKANSIYSFTFCVLCFFAGVRRGKKEYIRPGDDTTDKKN